VTFATFAGARTRPVPADVVPPVAPQAFHQLRVERLIGAARLALALLTAVALGLDLGRSLERFPLAQTLAHAYLVAALVLLVFLAAAHRVSTVFVVLAHGLDLAVAGALLAVTGATASPFFFYAMFLLVAAALRWAWPGTLFTGLAVVSGFLLLGALTASVVGGDRVEVGRFVLRAGYLVLAVILLGYLAAHERRLRRAIATLALRPAKASADALTHLREVLERAGAQLEAPRLVLAWEEGDEPWLHVAEWSPGELWVQREAPGAYDPLVPAVFAATSFACADAAQGVPIVRRVEEGRIVEWRGSPLHPAFRERFRVGSMLALALSGDHVTGHLFVLDRARSTMDDFALGEVVARQIEAALEQLYLVQRLQHAAADEERARLARDLHDGVIQALASAGLRLEGIKRQLADSPQAALATIGEIQDLLAAEQRDLRTFIQDPQVRGVKAGSTALEDRLAEICERVERSWDLAVTLEVDGDASRVPAPLAHEVDRIVHEALTNAAKHGQARTARVRVAVNDDGATLTVADDGHGFPFHGQLDDATLRERRLGPVTLKQRIDAAHGSLHIDSRPTGARLEIHLPW
jgi:signal transduction histidine kinase